MEVFVKEAGFKEWFRNLVGSSTNNNDLDDLNKVLTKSGLSEEAKADLRACRNKRVPEIEKMYELKSFERTEKTNEPNNRNRRTRTVSKERETDTRVVNDSREMGER